MLSEYFEEAVNIGSSHQIAPKTIADLLVNKKLNEIKDGYNIENYLCNTNWNYIKKIKSYEESFFKALYYWIFFRFDYS